ncbi:MAG: MATE family efflux transporter [Oscillospiraceae bacterium]|nr:MATE family efflux transporter [Oscillospiraceae bacterium]
MKRKLFHMDANGITEGVIWKQMILYCLPIMLGTLFQQLYNTVDAVIVGNFVGKEALAAVGGATGNLINLLVGLFVGLASGATVVISQYYGAGDIRGVSKAVHTAAALAVWGSFILMAIGFGLSPVLLRSMNTPEDIMPHAMTYIFIFFGGTIFSMIYNIGSGILRAVGDSKRPLYYLIVCCAVNTVLDLLFVAVFKWGVAGAALATVVAQAVSSVLVLVALVKTELAYRLNIKAIRIDPVILKDIVRIGIPAGLQSLMYSSSNLIVQSKINGFGTDVVAAWTAFGKLDAFFWMIVSAFGISITTFVGQNFGARKYDRMRKSVRTGMAMNAIATVIVSVLFVTVGKYLYMLFTQDANVIEIGVRMVRFQAPWYITYICIELLAGAVRGAGDSFIPTVLTGVGICVLRISWLLFVVPLRPELTMVMASFPITWVITSTMFVIYYLRGGWLKRRIKAVHGEEELTRYLAEEK